MSPSIAIIVYSCLASASLDDFNPHPLTQKLLMAVLAVSAALGAQARDAVAYPGGVCAAGLRVAF